MYMCQHILMFIYTCCSILYIYMYIYIYAHLNVYICTFPTDEMSGSIFGKPLVGGTPLAWGLVGGRPQRGANASATNYRFPKNKLSLTTNWVYARIGGLICDMRLGSEGLWRRGTT